MDALRRWQVATAATAVAGLGLGAMAVGHQPTEEVAPIELTPSPAATSPRVVPEEPGEDEDTEIVAPDVRSLEASLSSPADATTDPGTAPSQDPPSAPVDDSPEPADSVDSPDSLDSA